MDPRGAAPAPTSAPALRYCDYLLIPPFCEEDCYHDGSLVVLGAEGGTLIAALAPDTDVRLATEWLRGSLDLGQFRLEKSAHWDHSGPKCSLVLRLRKLTKKLRSVVGRRCVRTVMVDEAVEAGSYQLGLLWSREEREVLDACARLLWPARFLPRTGPAESPRDPAASRAGERAGPVCPSGCPTQPFGPAAMEEDSPSSEEFEDVAVGPAVPLMAPALS
jgi:hypothetical protein